MSGKREIDVILNLDDISLKIKDPLTRIEADQEVVWRFQAEEETVSGPEAMPFPRGWVPLVLFDVEAARGQPNLTYGPFGGLTKVLDVEPVTGDETLAVESKGGAGEAGVFGYYAAILRGAVEEEELGEHREWRLLSTARRQLQVEGSVIGGLVEARTAPDVEFEVQKQPGGLGIEQLKPSPTSPPEAPKINVDTNRVEWQFQQLGPEPGLYPSVLFYKYEGSSSGVNVSFGPFRRLTCEPGKVTGEDVSPIAGLYSYEAVLLTNHALNINLATTGDPQIDSEGDP